MADSEPRVNGGSIAAGVVAGVGLALLTVLFEVVLVAVLEDVWSRRLRVSGPGWVMLPLAAAVVGYRKGRAGWLHARLAKLQKGISGLGRHGRLVLVSLAVWTVLYCGYWLTFRPTYGYFGTRQITSFVWWLVLPPALIAIAMLAFRWAWKGNS